MKKPTDPPSCSRRAGQWADGSEATINYFLSGAKAWVSFENIGGYALWLHLDSRRNQFDRNTVRHSGGGGVLMTGISTPNTDGIVIADGVAFVKVAD